MGNDLPSVHDLVARDRHAAAVFPSPTTEEVVLTTPDIPGFEVHIPPKATILDHQGRVVEALTLAAIPVSRPPFPLPRGVRFPDTSQFSREARMSARRAHGSSTPTTPACARERAPPFGTMILGPEAGIYTDMEL